MTFDAGSFRDPNGRVLIRDRRVFRLLSAAGAADFQAATQSGLFKALQERGWLQPFRTADDQTTRELGVDAALVLEQEALPLVTYPYEWSFSLLRQAALHHLDVQMLALEHGIAMSDASAFNVQFVGTRPVFIDLTSFKPYREGDYWIGHQQFLNQFLNPLLLSESLGVPFSAWFRGNLAGIPTVDLQRLLPLRKRCSWRMLANVELPAYFQRRALKQQRGGGTPPARRPFPRAAYLATLQQLRGWIAGMRTKSAISTWSGYEQEHTYSDAEHDAKRAFIRTFVDTHRPDTVLDLGCNQGEYAEIALRAGARRVIGFDADLPVLDAAFQRAQAQALDFLPLYLDAANPSPNQDWNQTERQGLHERVNADATYALAFLHHIVIGSTIPLDAAVSWLVGLAPRGVIEFVAKSDPTVHRMLALREDVFPHYTEPEFVRCLSNKAQIVRRQPIKGTRTIYEFHRS
jgi:ribosomal protein L11 methylase PrmA